MILVCFLFNDEKWIRIIDGVGAVLYIVYGILIHSWSNIFLNAALVAVQVVKVVKLHRRGKDRGRETKEGNRPTTV